MAKNGVSLALYNGSDLGGMERPPDGVQDLMEEWFETAGLTAPLKYRIKTREVGAPHTKRVTPRGVHDGNFIYARIKPDSGGNGNCWVVWITIERGLNAQGVNVALERACGKVNDRSVERKTPTPAAPPDPYAELGLVELKSRAEAFKTKRDETKAKCDRSMCARDGHFTAVELARPVVAEAQRKLSEAEKQLQETEREISLSSQEWASINKEITLVEAALARKQDAIAEEIMRPMRDLIAEESARTGVPVEVLRAKLGAAP